MSLNPDSIKLAHELIARTREKTDFVSIFLGRFLVGLINGCIGVGDYERLSRTIEALGELDKMTFADVPTEDLKLVKEKLSPESKAVGREIGFVLQMEFPGSIKHRAVTMILQALSV
jgi:hypothetical protein